MTNRREFMGMTVAGVLGGDHLGLIREDSVPVTQMRGAKDLVECPDGVFVRDGMFTFFNCRRAEIDGTHHQLIYMAKTGKDGYAICYLTDKGGKVRWDRVHSPSGEWVDSDLFGKVHGHVRVVTERWALVADGVLTRAAAGKLPIVKEKP